MRYPWTRTINGRDERELQLGKVVPEKVPTFPDPLRKYDCTLAAFSIVLGKPVDELIALVGHDGREIVHPHLPAPLCHRGYHIQEWIDCCATLGLALILIEREPVSTPNGVDLYKLPLDAESRFAGHLNDARGVVFGRMDSGIGHSLAWIAPHVVDGLGRKTLLHHWRMQIMFFGKLLSLAP